MGKFQLPDFPSKKLNEMEEKCGQATLRGKMAPSKLQPFNCFALNYLGYYNMVLFSRPL